MAKLKTLENALITLNYFTYKRPAWGVRELARESGINHSVIYRILSTFEQFGYVKKNKTNNKYELGYKYLEFAGILQDSLLIPNIFEPRMKELTDKVGESTVLTWLDECEGIYINIIESTIHRVKFHESLGERAPLVYGASHKIILAYLEEEKRDKIIHTHFNNDDEKIEILKKEISIIQEQGWAFSRGEYLDGVAAVAVPVFNRYFDIVGSLSVAGPSFRMPHQKGMEYLLLLQKTQGELQAALNKILL